MIQLEYMPVVIEAHRAYLRSLAQPLPESIVVPSRRRALGQLIIRLGHWLEGHRPDIAVENPSALGKSAGNV